MKTRNTPLLTLAAAGLVLLAGNIMAQDSAPAAQRPAVSQSAPPLSAGTPQILSMVQAGVAESTVLAYVQNSSATYRLSAQQIIYLKQQGVSNTILDAMLNHQPAATQSTTVVSQPAVTYIQPAPAPVVYVEPYPYYSSPRYYGYYPQPYPAVSFSFGFGGGHRHGGHHGHHGRHGHWRR